jgi:hypothetical protein
VRCVALRLIPDRTGQSPPQGCSPDRWTADSSSTSTVLPTDGTGQSPDTGKARTQPHTEVAAKTEISVVSDPTAPQRHSTPAGLWFHGPGFQTLGCLLASSPDVRRSGIQHGCR